MEQEYLKLLKHVMMHGDDKPNRTGIDTRSVFGYQMRCNLQEGFPLLTTKKVNLKSIAHELLWFISGDTNVKYLQDNGVTIWDEWADKDGNLGPVYGAQWRDFGGYDVPATSNGHDMDPPYHKNGVDQLSEVIERIKKTPNDRRLIVSAWNPLQIPNMKLPPCHCFFQFYVSKNKLSCQMYQRSADMFLGVPFNIASYALLTHMVAQVCDLEVGDFVHTFGDTHIYHNHFEQVKEQLTREPFALPTIKLNEKIKNIFDFKYEDIELLDYKYHKVIKATVAV